MIKLALWCKNNGIRTEGSDISTQACARAHAAGLICNGNHSSDRLKDFETVVYTSAVQNGNPEFILAKKLNKTLIERTVFLNYIMQEYLLKIAVSGTHGKSTATGMLGSIFYEAGLFPEVHIGGDTVIPFNPPAPGCEKKVFITEACEYKKNFLKLLPDISVILNAECDHPDCYKNDGEIRAAFLQFAQNTEDTVIINGEDKNCLIMLPKIKKTVTFGFSRGCDYRGEILSASEGCAMCFRLYEYGGDAGVFPLNVIGRHNVMNALAAIAAARICGIGLPSVKQGLKNFKGIKRRLEKTGRLNKIPVISDYAHHPNEIRASLAALAGCGFNKILLVFQPHTFSRLSAYREDFKKCFSGADRLILTEVYGARESGDADLEGLATEITLNGTSTEVIRDFNKLVDKIKLSAGNFDCIVIMGAGNIDNLIPLLFDR